MQKLTLNSKILSFFFTLKKKEFRKIKCLEISLLKKAVNKTEAELFFIITNLPLLWRNLSFMNKILLLLDYLLLLLYNSKIKCATKFKKSASISLKYIYYASIMHLCKLHTLIGRWYRKLWLEITLTYQNLLASSFLAFFAYYLGQWLVIVRMQL